MKKNFSLGIATLLFAIISVSIFSCTTDKCSTVTCQNGGTCSDGNCNCLSGYEGSSCETRINTKFAGTYSGAGDCGSGSTAQSISISVVTGDPHTIDVHAFSEAIRATVSSNGTISIPTQYFGSGVTEESYSGIGALNGNVLSIDFTVTDVTSGDETYCSFSGTR